MTEGSCLNCGHKWRIEFGTPAECPECGSPNISWRRVVVEP